MAKLTRRSYKRKKVAFAAVILGGVALVSSGFAAWVLSNDVNQKNDGGIKYGTITDGTLKMEVFSFSNEAEDKKGEKLTAEAKLNEYFSFDADEKDTAGTQTENSHKNRMYWQEKGEEKPECLSNTFVVEITSDTDTLDNFNIKLSVTGGSFEKGVAAEYVVLPNCFSDTGVKISTWGDSAGSSLENDSYTATKTKLEDNTFKWTIQYTISFKWGGRFNGKNPCYFFDSDEKSVNQTDIRAAAEDDKIGKGYVTKAVYEISNADIKADMEWFTNQIKDATYQIDFSANIK